MDATDDCCPVLMMMMAVAVVVVAMMVIVMLLMFLQCRPLCPWVYYQCNQLALLLLQHSKLAQSALRLNLS